MGNAPTEWDGATVRTWLERRIAAARADQVEAERYGRERRDDCDKAAAEEMVCAALKAGDVTNLQTGFAEALRKLLAQEDYVWRGVYDDDRFDRHVRSCIRKVARMTKTNTGFANVRRYQ